MYAVVSRFLDVPTVLAHLDVAAPPVVVPDDDAPTVAGTASVDAYLADLFG
jgi:hypothetical protein